MAVIKWVDLSAVSVFLGSYRDANKEAGLAIIDMDGRFEKQIRELGFSPASDPLSFGVYLKPDHSITPAAMRAAFGSDSLKFFVAEQAVINNSFAAKVKEKTQTNATALFAQQRPIGFNSLGEIVQESIIGRYVIRTKDGKPLVVKETPENRAHFLRAGTLEDLADVAKGFVARITKRNEKLRKEHVQRLIGISNDGGFTARQYQEAIESALNGLFTSELATLRRSGVDDPLGAYDVANRIYVGMPELKERTPNSIANQQYSTPVPMSALAQSLLARRAELKGTSVLESTIGNGSLVSMLGSGEPEGCKVYGVEIDPARVEQVKDLVEQVIHGDATQTDFRAAFNKPDGFDFVIANPPFGSLDSKVDVKLPIGSITESMTTGRLDHLILLESLHARTESGRAVFITGADSALGDGEIKGRSKYLLNYLYDHYEVEGLVDVSGELYKKQGAEFPIRLYVIGARRAAPEQGQAPEQLPVIRTYEGLREWAAGVLAKQRPLSFDIKDLIEDEADASPQNVREMLVDPGQTATQRTANADTAQKVDDRQDSEFQQRYIAFSNVSEPSTMIPANLSGAVYESLAAIKELHGDVDDYVAKELDYPVGDLSKYFSAEQVDALAMIFHASAQDLGFLLADQMGVGKGRVLAGFARRERLQGRIPTFVTVKDNLFSDFLERDLAAIGSRDLFQNPLIINDGSKTVDASGEVVVKSMKRPEYRRYAENRELPPNTDLILLTYSQICRKAETHLTSAYLRGLADRYPLSLLLDESHNGAGASNTGDNLCAMIASLEGRGNVVYSSGTPIKGAKNLQLYRKILPKGVNTEELLEAVTSDPLSLQEALNYEIAAQGCLISRELDSTGVEKKFVISEDIERNRAIANQMSEILSAMAYLSGDVSKIVSAVNKKLKKELEEVTEEERAGARLGASSMNFGSRLYQINRQFLLALKAQDVVRHAQAALEANKKPIIALQHTGESLLTDFVTKANEVYESDPTRVQKEFTSVVLERPITFKDLMLKYLEKITWIKSQGRYGDVTYELADSKEIRASIATLKVLIDGLPDDLPLTPIDYVRENLGRLGYTVGEISGRNLRSVSLPNGGVSIEQLPGRSDKTRVNRAVREFNNGELDVLVLTGSGSTGLSVQASPAVGRDVRVRQMIKWEMQPDIAAERQMDGRHNRTGQIVAPEYLIPMTGLPADDRLAMMFNNKNRSLTSSTVANRDSKELIRDVPDLLNVVGDMVAEEFLFENVSMAVRLDIDLPVDSDERSNKGPLWYINKLTGRISLLRVDAQEALYSDLQSRFVERLDKLKAEGRNPLEVQCHDWKAKVVKRDVFMGAQVKTDNKRSQFNAPIYMTQLQYQKTLTAVRAEDIDRKIEANMKGFAMFGESNGSKTILTYIGKHRKEILSRSMSQRFKSLDEALVSPEPNEVQSASRKLDWLERNLPNLRAGTVFYRDDLEGKPAPHVVLRSMLPNITKPDNFGRLSDYVVYTMQAGSDLVEMQTCSSLFASEVELEPDEFRHHEVARAIFDGAENGVVTRHATVIDGNLFEATSLNLREHIGRKIVYTDEAGSRQHGILVAADKSLKKLLEIPERIRDVELLQALIALPMPITTSVSGDWKKADTALVIGRDRDGHIQLRVPGTKAKGGEVFLDPTLSEIAGKESQNKFDLKFSIISGKMTAIIPQKKISSLLEYFLEKKNMNFFVKDREVLQRVRASLETENAPELNT